MKRTMLILIITYFIHGSLYGEYTRNHVKEVVSGTNSGLMWQDSRLKHNGWKEAIDYCDNLKLADYNDWRLPNYNELYYLADRKQNQPAISKVFKNIVISNYWSSTAHHEYSRNNPLAWYVHFGPGVGGWEHEINDYYIRCVRNISNKIKKEEKTKIEFSNLETGQYKNIFNNDDGKLQFGIKRDFKRDNKKNIVIDNITKLQWQDDEINITLKKKWTDAKIYCEKVVFSGYDDWRLPNIDELVTLTNKGKYRNAIFDVFKKSKSKYYWSSSTYTQNKSLAWVINFRGGASFSQSKERDFNIRCVRDVNKTSLELDKKIFSNKEMKKLNNKNNKHLDVKLYEAIKNNNVVLSKTLINKGAYINMKDNSFGISSLHWAIINKNLEMVKLLIENGASINYADNSDMTALMYAASRNSIDIMAYLLKNKANINKTGMNGSALFFALKTNGPDKNTDTIENRKTADYLISKDIDLSLTNDDGETALSNSIRFGNIKAFKYLVKKGDDINKQNNNGENILFTLITSYNPKYDDALELMQYSIDNNININSPNRHLFTPLHVTVLYQRDRLIKKLVENGANLNIKDSYGRTPIYYAIEMDDIETMKYLIKSGAKYDIKDYNGITLFNYALEKKNRKIIEFLGNKLSN